MKIMPLNNILNLEMPMIRSICFQYLEREIERDMKSRLVITPAITFTIFVMVVITVPLVHADPWSWGHPPSKKYLHCFYTRTDCTHVPLFAAPHHTVLTLVDLPSYNSTRHIGICGGAFADCCCDPQDQDPSPDNPCCGNIGW
jgi:hypothetical protein